MKGRTSRFTPSLHLGPGFGSGTWHTEPSTRCCLIRRGTLVSLIGQVVADAVALAADIQDGGVVNQAVDEVRGGSCRTRFLFRPVETQRGPMLAVQAENGLSQASLGQVPNRYF